MDKTFGMSLRETKALIIEVLNSSGLPIDAVELLLGDLRTTVRQQADLEYQSDLRRAEEQEKAAEDQTTTTETGS